MRGALRLGSARRAAMVALLGTLLLTACAPGGQGSAAQSANAPAAQPAAESRALVVFIGNEPNSLATRYFAAKGRGLYTAWRMFNGLLALTDDRGAPQPELITSLPALNTDAWQVFPDGTMQTTYTLRPNLTWHDGHPLSADDFVFSWHVYSQPELGLSNQPPMPAIADVSAIDREHFQIHWKVPYPEADSISSKSHELPPLPQHLLGTAFDQIGTAGRDQLLTNPFWGRGYVGLGPYRLQNWEEGSTIDAVRFEGYALGVPKIPRIQLKFSGDQNVVLAHMLAGEAQVSADSSMSQAAADTLAEDWGRTNGGTILYSPGSWRAIYFQMRPELADPRAILDVRVRKALAHAVDKHGINAGIYSGHAIETDTPVYSRSAWGDVLDGSIPTYPFDLRATDRFLNEAGFSKGPDGFYRGADGRLSLELLTSESPDAVRELLAMASEMQGAGLDVQQRVIPTAQAQDSQLKATFPTMLAAGSDAGEAGLSYFVSAQIPSAGNLWQGLNRGGWSNADYDRLLTAFNTTLDRPTRVQTARQLLRVWSDDVAAISLFFPSAPIAYVSRLQGPMDVAPESSVAWNIHQWEFK